MGKFLYKVGYTADDNLDRRIGQYYSHSPGNEFISFRPGDELLERKLHLYFTDLGLKFRNLKEWFIGNPMILQLFHISLERLDRWLWKNRKRIFTDKILTGDKAQSILDQLYNKFNSVPVTFRKITKKDILGRELSSVTDPEEIKALTEFFQEYDKFTTFKDKLKFLCNYKFPNEEITNIVLNQLGGDKIRSYYVALGPEKLHALGYNQTKIEKTLGITMFDEDVLKNKIYSTFLPGDKYSLAEIKEKLKDLYNNLGYKKTPKAIDLLNYFEVKDFVYYEKDTLGKRKQIRGYEIISKKL